MKASRTSSLRRTGISTEATSGLVPSEPGWWRFQPCRLEDFAELKKFYGNALRNHGRSFSLLTNTNR